jgi:8-oxo-dGTP pyrophosphatase MutT (NUDIX family)
MMFEEFAGKLIIELKKDLPGFSVQNHMDPIGRQSADEYLNATVLPKKSAVMILLYPGANASAVHVMLIIRAENEKGSHSGQISFPGGGVDEADINLSDTALRETEEEIGVDRRTIKVIGELSSVYIPVSNYLVRPFVGLSLKRPFFQKQTLEVDDLLEIEINEFLSEGNKTTSDIFLKTSNRRMNVPCYNIRGKIIWGATAMIISEFAEVIRRVK